MRITRRQFIRATGTAGLTLAASPALSLESAASPIDRQERVRRFNPIVTDFNPLSPLTVGNGELAFTADTTGLQTFASHFEKEFPLCTASHWGWHTTPLPDGLRREDFRYKNYDTYGRAVGYATEAKGQETLFNWLRQNPHRLHLGRIGFQLRLSDGTVAQLEDVEHPRQTLDLWSGMLDSRFALEGKPVHVQTCCHPEVDLVAVRVESPLVATGQLRVLLAFPSPSSEMTMADWSHPDRHATECARQGGNRARFDRRLDADRYSVTLEWSGSAELNQKSKHEFVLAASSGGVLELTCLFSPLPVSTELPGVSRTQSAAATHWTHFWEKGGAIDLSASTDPRAGELERRIILSLYNTAIHCAGSLPAAETGLLFNSWHGKFHLEMHWWHSVHFVAWQRFPLFEKSLGLYRRILPLAQDTARRQGYRGARWPKMIGPDGHDSPSPVGPLLIWQQPHPIYYAELCYREQPDIRTLRQWSEIVFQSAEFLASYAAFDRDQNRFVLGPPLKTVSENTNPLTSMNPAFELAYWRFGLRVAQTWRERLGLGREPRWNEVLQRLSPLPVENGLYLMQEGMSDTYTKWNWEHPALLGPFGMQPGDGADAATLRRTARRVLETWRWDRSWGWDFPMAAMAAARSGDPGLAVEFLLMDAPKNRYLPNGHNYQRPGLPAYLPGNGGLLAAVAMMAAGWTKGPKTQTPGFPADGKWAVRAEGLRPCL